VIIECRNIMRPDVNFGYTSTVELNLTLWAILFAGRSPIIITKVIAEKVKEGATVKSCGSTTPGAAGHWVDVTFSAIP
jgi:hypothetical protein